MGMRRAVTVGFRGANNKIEQVSVSVPAEWISGTRDAMSELVENSQLKTRLSVNPAAAIWVEISEPYEENPGYLA